MGLFWTESNLDKGCLDYDPYIVWNGYYTFCTRNCIYIERKYGSNEK